MTDTLLPMDYAGYLLAQQSGDLPPIFCLVLNGNTVPLMDETTAKTLAGEPPEIPNDGDTYVMGYILKKRGT